MIDKAIQLGVFHSIKAVSSYRDNLYAWFQELRLTASFFQTAYNSYIQWNGAIWVRMDFFIYHFCSNLFSTLINKGNAVTSPTPYAIDDLLSGISTARANNRALLTGAITTVCIIWSFWGVRSYFFAIQVLTFTDWCIVRQYQANYGQSNQERYNYLFSHWIQAPRKFHSSWFCSSCCYYYSDLFKLFSKQKHT